jgi:two-component system cell cycle sensor histidine kinase/response regulator CckA
MRSKKLVKDRDKKFRLLFEENPQPMWVVDPTSQKLLDSNLAASRLYGYSPQEFRQLTVADLDLEVPLDSKESRPSWAASPQQRRPAVRRHRTKSGRLIDIELAAYDIDYGGRQALLVVLTDITGRRELEEQLRQSQKMEAIGMLAGGIAHDFNNLLTIITGYSQLILNNLKENDPNRHSAEQIMKAGERAAALTKQLLAFSRRQVLQLRVLDLNKLVTSLSAMLQRLIGEDIDLRLSLRPDLGRVSADPGQIEQVIMNLVVNARDAMPKGGILTLETANVELDSRYVHTPLTAKPGPYVMLAVSDNGIGMDASVKARLFEPFFTTKGSGKGTGLGLSTVFGIVKQSGGSLDVYSEPGKGTSFKIYLPRIDQPVAAEPQRQNKPVRRGWETILLVEDDEMVRKLVRETLEKQGYKILDAGGPLDARRIADHFPGAIHLMITDVVMPKVNGRELAEQLSKRRGDLRVLYMSGYTDNAVLNSGILAKDVAFLQKPFTPGALIEKVREVLEGDGKSRGAGE